MTEEQFIKAKQLFEDQWTFEKAIENAKLAQDWHNLIENFRRAGLPDFLGAFDIVKDRFISEVKRKLDIINKEIEEL